MFRQAFLILLAVVLFLLNLDSVLAQESSLKPIDIEVSNLQTDNGAVKGDLLFSNPNPLTLSDVYYVIKLQGRDINTSEVYKGKSVTRVSQGQLINFQNSDKFSLGANNSRQVGVNLQFSPAVPTGQYKLQILIYDNSQKLLGSYSSEVTLSGSGSFLDVKSCVIVAENVEYDPIIGPNVAPNAEVYGKCLVENTSATPISAFPQAEYAVNTVLSYGADIKTFASQKAINFPPKSTSNIILPLPRVEKPQVYEALSFLKDNQGNIVSGKKAFRWVIAGQSSAIRSITTDKLEYKKGETAKVTVGADPSMDLFWRGGGPRSDFSNISATSPAFVQPSLQGTPLKETLISVTVRNNLGISCGSKEQPVNIEPEQNIWPDQTLDVPIDKDCAAPTVTAAVKSGGSELAKKEIKLPVMVSGDRQKSANYWWIIGLVSLFVLVAGVGFYLWRKKKLPPIKPPLSTPTAAAALALAFGLTATLYSPASQQLSFVKPACAQSATPSASVVVTPSPSVSASISPLPSASLTPTGSPSATPRPGGTGRELGPGQNISVHYEGIKAYRPNVACPGPEGLFGGRSQPQFSDGAGGCVLDILSGHDETNFTFLDTQDQITYANGQFNAKISGQFKGFGCGNTIIGLIVRAYVNGSNQGVKINGGSSKAIFPNLAQNGGGAGTSVDFNLAITPGTRDICGPQNLKLELIPYIEHGDIATSDLAEDDLITDADVPGWQNVTYINRQNCGASGQSCWGVLQKTVQTVSCLACNDACQSTIECQGNKDGCVECVGGTCRVPPACNVACQRDNQCAGAKDGCTTCVSGTCRVPPACNTSCQRDGDCVGAKDGCTACVGGLCKIPPACNIACQKDGDCAGAKDGCTSCLGGVCKPPAACGTACSTRADCSTATKDGCIECLEGSCTNYNDNMCKCDGIVTEMNYPSNAFKFEAFGKVEGSDTKKAEIADITFRMTKDNQVVAKSSPIKPEIVENSGSKVRFKAAWQTPPPVDKNATYRVFADVRCKPKKIVASAGEQENQLSPVVIAEAEGKLPVPKGLQLIADLINKLFGKGNDLISKEALAQFSATSPAPNQAGNQLQLQTLNFIKMMDTDNCRFVMWKYDETLF